MIYFNMMTNFYEEAFKHGLQIANLPCGSFNEALKRAGVSAKRPICGR